jgi:HTH-type transcriptional regulator / antitoxin HigA
MRQRRTTIHENGRDGLFSEKTAMQVRCTTVHENGRDGLFSEEKMMEYTSTALPEPQAILQAWIPFKELLGVTFVRTEDEYKRASAIMESLLDEIEGDEDHPLADVLDYLADQVKVYEDEHYPIPESKPHEILAFVMDQHGLTPDDLVDYVPQDQRGQLSDMLSGERPISKEFAEKLSQRFHVNVDLFM